VDDKATVASVRPVFLAAWYMKRDLNSQCEYCDNGKPEPEASYVCISVAKRTNFLEFFHILYYDFLLAAHCRGGQLNCKHSYLCIKPGISGNENEFFRSCDRPSEMNRWS
jgi:hypothetical protein